jgi:phage shock protein PspC (stress-responsive transcriptional regulator)
MKRVTIINLAGTAWHVEEDGVAALEAWTADARARLSNDPDRDELLSDFERAIADRFTAAAPGDRSVVTGEQTTAILGALGTVEPADETAAEATEAAPTSEHPATTAALSERTPPRRFYRLEGEDSMLGGVCLGIASYFNVDVTVVRVLAVILLFVSSGAAMIAYIAIWLIAPNAETPDERATAAGDGTTAQEMLDRARTNARPALATLGARLADIGRALARFTRWVALTAVWILLVVWVLALVRLVVSPNLLLDAFNDGTSVWIGGLWLTCIAWIPIGLLLALEHVLSFADDAPGRRQRHTSIALTSAWVAATTLAIIGLFAIPASHSEQISSLADGHGTVRIYDTDVCIDVGRDARGNVTPPYDCSGADLTIRDD